MPVVKDRKISKACYFCVSNVREMDYQDTELLRKFVFSYGKIVSRKHSGVCIKHQKKLATAIRRAKIMGLLPFIVQ